MASLPPSLNQVPSFLPPLGGTIPFTGQQNTLPTTEAVNLPGGGGASYPPSIEGVIDDCMRSVRVKNVFPPAIVDVFVNGVWKGSAATPPIGKIHIFELTIDVPIAVCSLKVGDMVQATQTQYGNTQSALGPAVIVVSHVPYSCLTQHYNNERTGWNPHETQLTVANVPQLVISFHMREANNKPLDGPIYAQPLYMHQQYFPAKKAAYNVVFIATERDTVYAFDADESHQNDPYGPYLWKATLLPVGNFPTDSSDYTSPDEQGTSQTYENVAPQEGITGTPVIDCGCNCGCSSGCERCSTPTMYVVSKSKRMDGANSTFHFYLHALDVITGQERPNSPVEITGSVPGDSGQSTNPLWESSGDGKNVAFLPKWHLQRPGLLLLDGVVYVAFGSQNDAQKFAYHGWIMSYDTLTLEQKNIFCTSPQADINKKEYTYGGGSIWMGGMGLASDGNAIYCTTGNGIFNADTGGSNYGNCVLKLSKNLQVLSWFAPGYQATLNDADIDLGSGGVTVIPGMPNLLVTCGKDGNLLLLNGDNLGGYSGVTGWPPLPNLPHPRPIGPTKYDGLPTNTNSNPNAVDSILIPPGYYDSSEPYSTPGVWGGPAYFNGPAGQTIYYCANGIGFVPGTGSTGQLGFLTPFSLIGGTLNINPKLKLSTDHFTGLGGTTPIVSSNHEVSQTGIVWAVVRSDPAHYDSTTPSHQFWLRLRALDASDLSTLLFESNYEIWDSIYKAYSNDEDPPNTKTGGYPNTTNKFNFPKAGAAFIEPTVINGKVYVCSDGAVTVFGL